MADKKSFMIYLDYEGPISKLSDAESGQLFKALFFYASTGATPNLDGAAAIAFEFIRAQMDRDAEKWETSRQARVEAGRLGGTRRASARQSIQSEASQAMLSNATNCEAKPSNAKNAEANEAKSSVTVTVEGTVTDTVKVINTPPTPSKGEKRQPIPFGEIMELYNGICTGLPSIRSIEGQRKKAVAARWRAGPDIEGFRALFDKAQASRFLRGANERSWTASFDWLMKANNMAKVLEGLYDDKEGARQNGAGINREHPGGGEQPGGDDQYDLGGFKPPPAEWFVPDEHGPGGGGT